MFSKKIPESFYPLYLSDAGGSMSETVIQVRDVSMHFNLMEEKSRFHKRICSQAFEGKTTV